MAVKFICISASNVENARQSSASTRACKIIRDLLNEQTGEVKVEILRLLDYEPNPCRMCGKCYVTGECARDPDFNRIHSRLRDADGIFVVCPHYAPLPSKLVMVLEKLEEMTYLNTCANAGYRSPLFGKPVGIIAHGGQTDAALPYYHQALIDPLANVLLSTQMNVVSPDDTGARGVAFGIRSVSSQTDSIFVEIEHDWGAIRQAITPLVRRVAAQVCSPLPA